jgi:ribonuclease G
MQTIFTSCPYCSGSGMVKSNESVSIEIERLLKKIITCQEQFALKLITHPQVDYYLSMMDKQYLVKLAVEHNAHLTFETDDCLHLNEWYFYSTITNKRIEV